MKNFTPEQIQFIAGWIDKQNEGNELVSAQKFKETMSALRKESPSDEFANFMSANGAIPAQDVRGRSSDAAAYRFSMEDKAQRYDRTMNLVFSCLVRIDDIATKPSKANILSFVRNSKEQSQSFAETAEFDIAFLRSSSPEQIGNAVLGVLKKLDQNIAGYEQA